MNDNTIKFVVPEDSSEEMKTILTAVYGALSEKGYNPISQIVGYILSEDPTYITTHKRTNTHTKAISAPAAPAATVMAPGGELASTVRLPPTAPPASACWKWPGPTSRSTLRPKRWTALLTTR